MKRILMNILLLILFIINDFESSKNPPISDGERLENIITTQQDLNTINEEAKVENKVADPEILPPAPTEDTHTLENIIPHLNTVNEEVKSESKLGDPEILPPAPTEDTHTLGNILPHLNTINEEVKSESKLGDPIALHPTVTREIELIETLPSLRIDTKKGENFRKRSPEYKQSYSDDDDFVQETPIRYTLKRSLSANGSPTNQYYQEMPRLQKQSKTSFSARTFSNRQFTIPAFQSSTNITDATAILNNGKLSVPQVSSKLSIQPTTAKTSIRSTSMRPVSSKISTQRPPITLEEISNEIALRYINIKNNNLDRHDLLTLDIEQALLDEENSEQTITPKLIRILNEKIFHILEESKQTLGKKRQIQPVHNQIPHTTTHGNMSTTNQPYTQDPDSSSSRLSPQEPSNMWTDEQPYPMTPTIEQQQEDEENVYSKAIQDWLQLSLSEQLKYNVLSIDGGGVRGIVACKLIEAIEDKKNEQINPGTGIETQADQEQPRTGIAAQAGQEQLPQVRIQDFFNVYTGTSIGGIIAVGLLLQDVNGNFLYHPSELKYILMANAPTIFQKKFTRHLTQLFRPRYSNKNLKLLIETMIMGTHEAKELCKAGIKYEFTKYRSTNNEQDSILSRGAKNVIKNLSDIKTRGKNIRLIIPSYDIQNKKILMFDSDVTGEDFSLVDICMATSAAPLYFPTYPVTPTNDNTARYNCVDGGLFLNFPASATISRLIDHCMLKPQIYTVSITTGSIGDVTENNREKRRGLINWLRHGLINIMRSSPTQLAEDIVNNCVKNHVRLCVRLETASKEMDDSRWTNLTHLIIDTESYIRNASNLFKTIIDNVPLISNNTRTTANPGNRTYSMLGNGPITPARSQYMEIGFPMFVNGVYPGMQVPLPPLSPSSQYYSQGRNDLRDTEETLNPMSQHYSQEKSNTRNGTPLDMKDI